MKNLALAALLALFAQSQYSFAATLTVQNSSDNDIQVWLYDEKNELIDTGLVDTNKPKTLNSHFHGIATITWAPAKYVPKSNIDTTKHLNRNSAGGTPFSFRLNMKPLSVGHKFFVLNNGSYKYQPGLTKKEDTISGRARRLSEVENQNKIQ